MSTDNVESIPLVVINKESNKSPNKSIKSIKSSRSTSPASLSFREKIRKEINEQRIETVAEISNILEIFANDRKKRGSL